MELTRVSIIIVIIVMLINLVRSEVILPDPGHVCVNDEVVFTCRVTEDTGLLFVIDGVTQPFSDAAEVDDPISVNGFELELVGAINNVDYNATARRVVGLDDDGIIIRCEDSADSKEQSVKIQDSFARSVDGVPTVDVADDCSSITVSWTPPTSPPCAVASYTLTITSGQDDDCTHTGDTTSTSYTFTPTGNCHISWYTSVIVTATDEAGRRATGSNVVDISDALSSSCSAHFCSDNCMVTYLNKQQGINIKSTVNNDGRVCSNVNSCSGELHIDDDGLRFEFSSLINRKMIINASGIVIPQQQASTVTMTTVPISTCTTMIPSPSCSSTSFQSCNGLCIGLIIVIVILVIIIAILIIIVLFLVKEKKSNVGKNSKVKDEDGMELKSPTEKK